MSAVFVYVTAPNAAEAEKIATAVVEERLAACANIIPGMTSIYRWQGKIEKSDEVVLVLKTRATSFDALEKRVRELHSYDTPCIAALPLTDVSEDFLKWVTAETAR